jgi:hypothetical protein
MPFIRTIPPKFDQKLSVTSKSLARNRDTERRGGY